MQKLGIVLGLLLVGILIFGCTAQSNATNQVSETPHLEPDYCFYNSTAKTISCGRPLVLVKKGVMYNVSSNSTEISFCGLTGLADSITNEAYLIYIFEKSDQLIHLINETSQKAMGYQVTIGNECNITAPQYNITEPQYTPPIPSQNSPLDDEFYNASKFGDMQSVTALINEGADVNTRDDLSRTALMHAATTGYKDLTQLLIDNGADVNAKDVDGVTALMFASKLGRTEIAEILVNSGADVNATANNGANALIYALTTSHRDVSELLINAGTDVNAKTRSGGDTALIWASHLGYTDIVELLISKGADVNARTTFGYTPLTEAANPEIVEILEANGAK